MDKLIVLLIIISLGCGHNENKKEDSFKESVEKKNSGKFSKGIVNDGRSDSICNIITFAVNTGKRISSKYTYKGAIVIKFDKLIKAIEKYDNGQSWDTLYKILEDDSRQRIYRVTDQWGWFKTDIYPKIVENEIQMIDKPEDVECFVFEDHIGQYQVNVNDLKLKDGLLMFQVGKPPIFWTEHEFEKICADSDHLIDWYFNQE